MRLLKLIPLSLVLVLPGSSFAQGWIKHVDETERFIVNFPREPDAKEIEYITEQGASMPAHLFSVEDAESRYSVTIVAFPVADAVHEGRCRHLN